MSIFDGPEGSTPLDPDATKGLIPTWIATRGDLNAAERDNIAKATTWIRQRRLTPGDLSQAWLKNLHRRMFSDVWRWAGSYRLHDTNLGLPWAEISFAVEGLVRDMHVHVDMQAWVPDETAIRFHHRLVFIHPFANGNGRHARLAADVLIEALGEQRFSWGARARRDPDAARREYVSALRIADRAPDYEPLLRFARS